MPRLDRVEEGFVPGSCKIRKRGCSSSSSSSSVLQNYRFKRAILVGKAARGSRSSTPVPSWRTSVAEESPKYSKSIGGKSSRPVSARKLAATLWEMNEVPSPRVVEDADEKRRLRRDKSRARERMGLLPSHLSDPSHSPVSERLERSGTGSRHKRSPPSVSHQLRLADKSSGILDSPSRASLMETESRSRGQTPSGSGVGVRARLKDVSSALTTSKELLKIVCRISARDDQSSSSLSLISALHAELERARLQVNKLIQEHRSEQIEITQLIDCFAEEKAAWKSKEQRVVESAIESVASELEVERKLRRRVESLNKKLGKELSETKESLMKAVNELEREKRARDIMAQVCDDLAGNIGEDKEDFQERVSEKIHEVEKERDILHLADMLCDERAHMKVSDAKHEYEEKNIAVDKLKNQLEALMNIKKGKDKGQNSSSRLNTNFPKNEDEGEVESGVDFEEHSGESDLHSIELNMDNNKRSYKWTNSLGLVRDSNRVSIDYISKGRNSIPGRPPRNSTSIQRSVSDVVEWADQSESIRKLDESLDRERLHELEKQALVQGLIGRVSSSSRRGSVKDVISPMRQSSRDLGKSAQEKASTGHMGSFSSRLASEARRSRC